MTEPALFWWAILTFLMFAPFCDFFHEAAGIPDYGCNPNQHAGYTILYMAALLPTTAAFFVVCAYIANWMLFNA